MRHFFHSTPHQYGRFTMAAVLALAVLLLAGTPASATPLAQGTIHRVYISDVRNTSFVVSWTTELPSTASVNYGTTPTLGSSRADILNPTQITTHHVTVSGLSPNTTYYFDTESNGVVDNNGGAHYTVTTGPTLSSVPGTAINGVVYQSDGLTPVPNAIVYLQVRHLGVDSQLVALRAFSPGGQFSYNLSNLRTADNQAWFPYAVGDIITLTGQGGVLGTGQITPPVPVTPGSVGNIILNNVPTAITLRTLTTRTEAIAWLPIGLILLGASAVLIVRKRRS